MKLTTYIKNEEGQLIDRIKVDPQLIPEVGQPWKPHLFSKTYRISSKLTDITTERETVDVFIWSSEPSSEERVSQRELVITRIAIAIACASLGISILNFGNEISGITLFTAMIAGLVVAVYVLKRLRLGH